MYKNVEKNIWKAFTGNILWEIQVLKKDILKKTRITRIDTNFGLQGQCEIQIQFYLLLFNLASSYSSITDFQKSLTKLFKNLIKITFNQTEYKKKNFETYNWSVLACIRTSRRASC